MVAILNFGGVCTDDLTIIKTMGDKLKSLLIIHHNISVGAMS